MLNNLTEFLQRLTTIMVDRFPILTPQKKFGITNYIFVFVLMALSLVVRLAIAPVNAGLQYVTFFPAVTFAAITSGLRGGLLATAIGLCFATFILSPPYYSISIDVFVASFLSNMVFLFDGFIVSFSIDSMHRYRQNYLKELNEVKEAGQQLRIAASAFETHEAILITDANANIIRVNNAFERITGYSEKDVIGKNPRILSSGRHEKGFYKRMWESLLSAGSWNGEVWDKGKDGHLYPKEMTISSVKDEQGRISNFVAIFTDISERKNAEERIHTLAYHDALTGLPNRRLLHERLELALSASARNHLYGALLFLDLDKFKTLNDALGHEFGDMLLIEVAQRIKFCVREVDTVARLGGDEFVVLVENLSADTEVASQHVANLAEKIRATLATPYHIKENTHHTSSSIGVSLYSDEEVSADDLIKHADMAMYQAKEAGRNQVRFFDASVQESVLSRAALESDLRVAIANRQFSLFYQIQVDSHLRPVGAEALIRWIHPQRGMVLPMQFIPVAEESLLILEIGYWVLDTACQQIAEWRKNEHTSNLVLAINVSAKQFMQPVFVGQVEALLHKYHIEPSRLKLELTEGVALNGIDSVIEKMHLLRELGITLSLDDFGTGYSSLSYLRRLPLDQIKIDQSFVREITTNSSDALMVKSIIGMAQNLNLNLIAEGVETQEHLSFLKKSGCMFYQGYLFSKPVPIEAFEALLK